MLVCKGGFALTIGGNYYTEHKGPCQIYIDLDDGDCVDFCLR